MRETVRTLPSLLPRILTYSERVFITIETDERLINPSIKVITLCADNDHNNSHVYVIPVDVVGYRLIEEERDVLVNILHICRLVCFNQIETGALLKTFTGKEKSFEHEVYSIITTCEQWCGVFFNVEFMKTPAWGTKTEDDGVVFDIDDKECLEKCASRVLHLIDVYKSAQECIAYRMGAFLTVDNKYRYLLSRVYADGIRCNSKVLWNRMRSFKLDVVTNQYKLDKRAGEPVDINDFRSIRRCILEKTSITPVEHTRAGLPSVKNSAVRKMLVNELARSNKENAEFLANLLLCQHQKIQWETTNRFTGSFDREGGEYIYLNDTTSIGEINKDMLSALVPGIDKKFVGIRLYLPEVYILAITDGSSGILEAYTQGLDVISYISRRIACLEDSEELPEGFCENVNRVLNGVVHGLDNTRIAIELKRPEFFVEGILKIINEHFDMLSCVENQIVEKCKASGFISSFLGRKNKCLITEWNDVNKREALAISLKMTKDDLIKMICLKLDGIGYRVIPFSDFIILEVANDKDEAVIRSDIGNCMTFTELGKPILFRGSIKCGYDVQSVIEDKW